MKAATCLELLLGNSTPTLLHYPLDVMDEGPEDRMAVRALRYRFKKPGVMGLWSQHQ
jgi:hypothetical protein